MTVYIRLAVLLVLMGTPAAYLMAQNPRVTITGVDRINHRLDLLITDLGSFRIPEAVTIKHLEGPIRVDGDIVPVEVRDVTFSDRRLSIGFLLDASHSTHGANSSGWLDSAISTIESSDITVDYSFCRFASRLACSSNRESALFWSTPVGGKTNFYGAVYAMASANSAASQQPDLILVYTDGWQTSDVRASHVETVNRVNDRGELLVWVSPSNALRATHERDLNASLNYVSDYTELINKIRLHSSRFHRSYELSVQLDRILWRPTNFQVDLVFPGYRDSLESDELYSTTLLVK